MHIDAIGKNNFDWKNKLAQILDGSKKNAGQTNQPLVSGSKKGANLPQDAVELSQEAKQRARVEKAEIEDMASRYEEMMRQLETAREQGEAAAESAKVRTKCMLIAMRIMNGDKVPPEDYRYLAKNDIKLYAKAVTMRMEKENPKKHKRLSEDEKSSAEGSAGGEGGSLSSQIAQADIGEILTEAGAASSENSDS